MAMCHVPLTVLRGLELFPTEPLANYTFPPTLYRWDCRLNCLIGIGLRVLNQARVQTCVALQGRLHECGVGNLAVSQQEVIFR